MKKAFDEINPDQSVGSKELQISVLHTKLIAGQRASEEEISNDAVKVILAKNIAESSLTVKQVAVVIDFGVVRQSVKSSLDGVTELT